MAVQNYRSGPPVRSPLERPEAELRGEGERDFCIRPAKSHERSLALSLLFRKYTARNRDLLFRWATQISQVDRSVFDLLLIAERFGQIRGAGWGRTVAGRIVVCWEPVLVEGENETTRSLILKDLDHRITLTDTQVAYASLYAGQQTQLAALASNNFHYITDIAQMVCELSEDSGSTVGDELEFASYKLADTGRLKSLIQRSWEKSLDCAAMRGIRQIDDVLEGHYHREGYSPSHWKIIRHRQRDIGCLLLSRNQHKPEFDVVYLALSPDARGHGWGANIIQYAKQLAYSAGGKRLLLTCDVNNPPALKTYLREGLHETDRWSVFIRDYSNGTKVSREEEQRCDESLESC